MCLPAHARQNVKTKEFLTLDSASRDYFIRLTINTATVIATQIKRDMALCIADWYGSTPMAIQSRNTEILNIMENIPDSYPSAVLIAILQKKCGKFGQ